jgi:hypothetical protein
MGTFSGSGSRKGDCFAAVSSNTYGIAPRLIHSSRGMVATRQPCPRARRPSGRCRCRSTSFSSQNAPSSSFAVSLALVSWRPLLRPQAGGRLRPSARKRKGGSFSELPLPCSGPSGASRSEGEAVRPFDGRVFPVVCGERLGYFDRSRRQGGARAFRTGGHQSSRR